MKKNHSPSACVPGVCLPALLSCPLRFVYRIFCCVVCGLFTGSFVVSLAVCLPALLFTGFVVVSLAVCLPALLLCSLRFVYPLFFLGVTNQNCVWFLCDRTTTLLPQRQEVPSLARGKDTAVCKNRWGKKRKKTSPLRPVRLVNGVKG